MSKPPPNLEEMRIAALNSLHEKAQKTMGRKPPPPYRNNGKNQQNHPYNSNAHRPMIQQPTGVQTRNLRSTSYKYDIHGLPIGPQGPHRSSNYVSPAKNLYSAASSSAVSHSTQQSTPIAKATEKLIILDPSPSPPEESDDIVEIPPPPPASLLPPPPPAPPTDDTDAAKLKEASNAIKDLQSFGYNYYDLVVLAKIHPKFLDEHFPELKNRTAQPLKRSHDQVTSTHSTALSQEPTRNLSAVQSMVPAAPTTTKKNEHSANLPMRPAFAATPSQRARTSKSTSHTVNSSIVAPVPLSAVASKHPSSLTSLQNALNILNSHSAPSASTPQLPKSSTIPKPTLPLVGTSSHAPAFAYKHAKKKIKFGSDRWSHSMVIAISDSEDSDNEDGTSRSLRATQFHTTTATPTSSQSSISVASGQTALMEKIRLLQQRIEKAESSKINTPLQTGSSTPSSRMNTPPSSGKVASARVNPKGHLVASSPIPSSKSSIDGGGSSPASRNTTKALAYNPQSKTSPAQPISTVNSLLLGHLKSQRESLDSYSKDQELISKKKQECLAEIESIDLNKVEREVQELKIAFERKMKEHLEKKILAATAKAKLESLLVQESGISNIISQLKSSIAVTEEKVSYESIPISTPEAESRKPSEAPESPSINEIGNDDFDVELTVSPALPEKSDTVPLDSSSLRDDAPEDFEDAQSGDSPAGSGSDSEIEIVNIYNNNGVKVEDGMGSATPLTTSDAQEEVSDMDREASVDSITPLSHLEADVKCAAIPFTPYDSPLKMFRSFRFSPFFKSMVAGGYKSLTYSPQIRDGYICNGEFTETGCTIPNCSELHFKDIEPSEFSIVNDMAKAFIGDTPEEINRYRTGLVEILKAQGESLDFARTAALSMEYRRSKAPDRILDWHKFKSVKAKQEKTLD